MNASQLVLTIAGMLVLAGGPILFRKHLAELILRPRSLPRLLLAMALVPLFLVLFFDWRIIVFAAGHDRTIGRAIVDGGAALFRAPMILLFVLVYAFFAWFGYVTIWIGRRGERGARAFAKATGLEFTKRTRFRLSPLLGSVDALLLDIVTISPDSFVAAYLEQDPRTTRRRFYVLSIAVGPIASGTLSGTWRTESTGEGDVEVVETGGVKGMVPRADADQWRRVLGRVIPAAPGAASGVDSITIHDGQMTILGSRLDTKEDYARMASLVDAAAGRPPRSIA